VAESGESAEIVSAGYVHEYVYGGSPVPAAGV
jgi:hypothetical protein